ncbi:MAG TPA: A/G-specific adenine glycosylase, partial [Verrucomicrobiae bacterium]|nr:A/G-specific adenine glycosylase [Verrucomicrobiae bacterium]
EIPPAATTGELDAVARTMMAPGRAHDWNSALMDLGASLCTARAPKCLVCPLRDRCRAAPVDAAALELARRTARKRLSKEAALPFARTARFARGRIVDRLRALPPGRRISLLDLHGELAHQLDGRSVEELGALVGALERDGLVASRDDGLALRE